MLPSVAVVALDPVNVSVAAPDSGVPPPVITDAVNARDAEACAAAVPDPAAVRETAADPLMPTESELLPLSVTTAAAVPVTPGVTADASRLILELPVPVALGVEVPVRVTVPDDVVGAAELAAPARTSAPLPVVATVELLPAAKDRPAAAPLDADVATLPSMVIDALAAEVVTAAVDAENAREAAPTPNDPADAAAANRTTAAPPVSELVPAELPPSVSAPDAAADARTAATPEKARLAVPDAATGNVATERTRVTRPPVPARPTAPKVRNADDDCAVPRAGPDATSVSVAVPIAAAMRNLRGQLTVCSVTHQGDEPTKQTTLKRPQQR